MCSNCKNKLPPIKSRDLSAAVSKRVRQALSGICAARRAIDAAMGENAPVSPEGMLTQIHAIDAWVLVALDALDKNDQTAVGVDR